MTLGIGGNRGGGGEGGGVAGGDGGGGTTFYGELVVASLHVWFKINDKPKTTVL